MSLSRNAFANLAAGVLPAIVMLATIPYIVTQLGDVNYGLLILITAIVGYFSIIDLNVTSGSVRFIASHHATGLDEQRDEVISFGGLFYLALGLFGCMAIEMFAIPLAANIFAVPKKTLPLAIEALQIAGLGFLFAQLQVYLQSILQALQRYDVTARIEIVFGMLVPILTVALLLTGYGLIEIVWLRVIASLINVLILTRAFLKLFPAFRLRRPKRAVIASISTFSAWAYLSKFASTTQAYADKLIVGSIIGLATLTNYTLPVTLAGRLQSLCFRLASVTYPAACALGAVGDHAKLEYLYYTSTRYLLFINLTLLLVIALFAREILSFWVGERFVPVGAPIMVFVAAGMLLASLTNIPSMFNDALSSPKITGLFAALNAVLVIIFCTAGAHYHGAQGAALGLFVASLMSSLGFLIYVHGRSVPFSFVSLVRKTYFPLMLPAGIIFFVVTALRPAHTMSWQMTLFAITGVVCSWAAFGWWRVLAVEHRIVLMHYFRILCNQKA